MNNTVVSYKKHKRLTPREHLLFVFLPGRIAHVLSSLFVSFHLSVVVLCPITKVARVTGLSIIDCNFGFL